MDFGAIFFPSAIILTLVGIIVLMGLGFSYVWLRIIQKQFNKCPSCGRTGAAELISTEVISSKNQMDYKGRLPARVTIKTIEDQLECRFCKHQWIDSFEETKRVLVKQ